MSISKKAVGNTLGLMGSFNNWAADVPFTYDALTSTWKTGAGELARQRRD